MKSFGQAFRKASTEKPIEFLMLVTTTIALIAAIISVVFLGWQLIGLNEALESQAYSYIDNNQIELDKIFVQNSEYRPCFYKNASLPQLVCEQKNADDINKVAALADLKLDVIDAFYTQADHIDWSSRYSRGAWEQYYNDSFSHSAVLCKRICDDWMEYGKHIREAAAGPKACDKTIKVVKDPKTKSESCEWMSSK